MPKGIGYRRKKKKKSLIKRAKDKVIDKVSDAIVAPKRFKVKRKIKNDTSKIKTIQAARAYDNAPDFDSKGKPTDAFKTRTMAEKYLDDFKMERAAAFKKKKRK